MADFIFLMHDDATAETNPADWERYITGLRKAGAMQGGSAIGAGVCARKSGEPAPLTAGIEGYLRVTADDLTHARTMLAGNSIYEAGGALEIRELPTAG